MGTIFKGSYVNSISEKTTNRRSLKSNIREKIAFMQGRLVPMINGKIQAFPWEDWEKEFEIGANINVRNIEWTIDQENFYENPIFTKAGIIMIKKLKELYNINIPSLTGDSLMQAPFWKSDKKGKEILLKQLIKLIEHCNKLEIKTIVYPLVDNSSLENKEQEDMFIDEILKFTKLLEENNVRIAFESNYEPRQLKKFIDRMPSRVFGINYDVGNSASEGYNPEEEFANYADRVINVHIKDRKRKGTTVRLGEGHADFNKVFKSLSNIHYKGYYVLQTARSEGNDHIELITKYASMVENWHNDAK